MRIQPLRRACSSADMQVLVIAIEMGKLKLPLQGKLNIIGHSDDALIDK